MSCDGNYGRPASAAAIAVLGFALLGSTAIYGSPILLDNFLGNASFESPSSTGTPPGSCPTSWTCSGSPAPGFGTYTVTSQQYTPSSDGLSRGLVVPDGAQAAFAPTTIEGSGDLFQTTPLTYIPGDT